MTVRMLPIRLAASCLALSLLFGCTALASLDSASEPLATYELRPAIVQGGQGGGGGGALLVATPSATAALSTNRIAIKPNPLEVAYLPGARWTDAAPRHVQTLLVRSLANSGRLRYVTGESAGPLPDYVLMSDLQAFQAEVAEAPQGPFRVVIRLSLTLVRDRDSRIVATRGFTGSAVAATSDPLTIVSAFDAAMNGLLANATAWSIAAMAQGRV